MDGRGAAGVWQGDPDSEGRDATLYRLVIPSQSLVVRVNGLAPDALEGDYLAAVRPYGVLGMAWAIWREVPGAEPKEALSLARRVRRKGEAEVLVAACGLAEHVRGMLRVRHRLVARLEQAG